MENLRELYYYTSSDTMSFILTGQNIYATNLKYMNDGEEYINGLTELRTVLNKKYCSKAEITMEEYKKAITEQPRSYSISFSQERDLLSQWSMYAKESGVNMRMDFSQDNAVDIKYYELQHNNCKIKDKEIRVLPHKVYYLTKHVMTEAEYKDISTNLIKDIEEGKTVVDTRILTDIQDGIDAVWRLLAPYVKRREFYQEAEYRLVFNLNAINQKREESIKINYRSDKSVLKPYLNVKRKDGWPIREIIVGPGFNQRQVYESVRHFLDNADIHIPKYDAEDIKSEITYYLKRLDKDERIKRTGQKLSEQWEQIVKKGANTEQIIGMFHTFIDGQRKNLKRIDSREYVLDYVYMTKKGIILTISEIPYIY